MPVHAERRRLPHVEVETAQDLIADEAAEDLGRALAVCCLKPIVNYGATA